MDPAAEALAAKRLKGTSQGKKTDIPPAKWIREELKQFGTIDTSPTYKADLEGEHPFRREAFSDLDDDRYAPLEQSFRLAARLLNTARPYLCNFLRQIQLVQWSKRGKLSEIRVLIKDDRPIKQLVEATKQLAKMLEHVRLQEDESMYKSHNVLGLTHTGLTDWPDEILGSAESEEAWSYASKISEELGLPFQQLTIAFASQMVDAIIASEPNTEQHMNAIFQAAITITHEIGHAIYYCHKDRKPYPIWVGDDILWETGHSLVAWLFDGFFPQPISLEDDNFSNDFRSGHCWRNMLRKPCLQPRARVIYSMPMAHIQKLLSNQSWAPYRWHDPTVHV